MLQLRLVTDAIVNEPQDADGPLVVVGEVVRTGSSDEPVTVLVGLFDAVGKPFSRRGSNCYCETDS